MRPLIMEPARPREPPRDSTNPDLTADVEAEPSELVKDWAMPFVTEPARDSEPLTVRKKELWFAAFEVEPKEPVNDLTNPLN